MHEEISVKDVYGSTLVEMASENENIVVVEADLMRASGSEVFLKKFPQRHFQVGVAEQNLIGVGAGLAASGKIPFVSTFANFASKRACDQASISAAYNKLNVKICGTYAGLTSTKNGGTHISVEDIAIFRSMPNMVVVVPADTVELREAMKTIATYQGPVYLRMARGPMPRIFPENHKFALGKSSILSEGDDATIISTGIMTYYALQAAKRLAAENINVKVINSSTIKPIDEETILEAAESTGALVTVENHNIMGGLGSAVAEIVVERKPVPLKRIGIRDRFGETATLEWLLKNHKMAVPDIVDAVRRVLTMKGQ